MYTITKTKTFLTTSDMVVYIPSNISISGLYDHYVYYYSVCEEINVCFLQNNRVHSFWASDDNIKVSISVGDKLYSYVGTKKGNLPNSFICVNCSTLERQCKYNSCYFHTVISVRLQIYVNHHLLTKHPPPSLIITVPQNML